MANDDWEKLHGAFEGIPIDPVSMSSDQLQRALDRAAEKLKEIVQAKILEALAIPAATFSQNYASAGYATAKNDASGWGFSRRMMAIHIRRWEQVFALESVLPAWITHNRRWLADDLWFAGEAFRRSVEALGFHHRLGVHRYRPRPEGLP